MAGVASSWAPDRSSVGTRISPRRGRGPSRRTGSSGRGRTRPRRRRTGRPRGRARPSPGPRASRPADRRAAARARGRTARRGRRPAAAPEAGGPSRPSHSSRLARVLCRVRLAMPCAPPRTYSSAAGRPTSGPAGARARGRARPARRRPPRRTGGCSTGRRGAGRRATRIARSRAGRSARRAGRWPRGHGGREVLGGVARAAVQHEGRRRVTSRSRPASGTRSSARRTGCGPRSRRERRPRVWDRRRRRAVYSCYRRSTASTWPRSTTLPRNITSTSSAIWRMTPRSCEMKRGGQPRGRARSSTSRLRIWAWLDPVETPVHGLVRQDERPRWLGSARDGHALALPARELARVGLGVPLWPSGPARAGRPSGLAAPPARARSAPPLDLVEPGGRSRACGSSDINGCLEDHLDDPRPLRRAREVGRCCSSSAGEPDRAGGARLEAGPASGPPSVARARTSPTIPSAAPGSSGRTSRTATTGALAARPSGRRAAKVLPRRCTSTSASACATSCCSSALISRTRRHAEQAVGETRSSGGTCSAQAAAA